MKAPRLLTAVAAALGLTVAACGERPISTFSIVSGSENRTLEPIVQEFCKTETVACSFEYMGSLDIGMAVADNRGSFDAVWPANSFWIEMFDRDKRVRDLTSVMHSPVILGVRESKARELGWVGRDVSSKDIEEAVQRKQLTYLASSATQSNSGANAYLLMLSAALGHPDVITQADLDRPDVREKVGTLLAAISRTAGSSAWVADLYLKGVNQGVQYDAMWNYEAILAETNQTLKQRGHELLYAIYPSDGVGLANSPLGFVERGRGPQAEAFFSKLQKYLLSDDVQKRLVESYRRPAVGEAKDAKPDPSWNYDPTLPLKLLKMPEPAVVRTALDLYQDGLRRPSLTVYCLDFSREMAGQGEQSLRKAMNFILSRDQSAPLLVQHAPKDQIVIIPFDAEARPAARGSGSPADQARLLDFVMKQQTGGDSDFYACAERGLAEVTQTPNSLAYLPAIIVLTNGKSDDRLQDFLTRWRASHRDIPIFGITFQNADTTQIAQLAEATRGAVFDGTKSLTEAFRTVRGYN
ncbi:MAG: substrate-binding domain-containing protein [Xanthobacteraceae bacterium]|nr:substrate-binding domain-containing protein [Xanthobacteraceae bacterium]MBV9630731.1 substrate-binding domain-containing protein [Xanthobacteraceae bacterium]